MWNVLVSACNSTVNKLLIYFVFLLKTFVLTFNISFLMMKMVTTIKLSEGITVL